MGSEALRCYDLVWLRKVSRRLDALYPMPVLRALVMILRDVPLIAKDASGGGSSISSNAVGSC
jgi:hypothetical protein